MRTVPLIDSVAATSVGIVDDELLLDLAYEEDSRAQVDMNVVMTGGGRFVEVQASAEGRPYTNEELQQLLDLASGGIRHLSKLQQEVVRLEIPWPVAIAGAERMPVRILLASSNRRQAARVSRTRRGHRDRNRSAPQF